VEVNVDGVQPDKEIGEDLFLVFRNITKDAVLKLGAGGEWAEDGYVKFEGLGIDITDIYTTGRGEEECVSVAGRCDANVIFCIGRVREEWFDDEGVECSGDRLDLGEE